ncbi:MAG: hypothetical protein ACOCP4_03745 [Candidatus Woesearchaeota archaeon]
MWENKETENYIFYYHENTDAERDLNQIIEKQEGCYEYICDVLKEKLNFKIKYYLCDSKEEVGLGTKFEDRNTKACGTDKEVHVLYNDEKVKNNGYHEDVHVIAYNTLNGHPKYYFIIEGLAQYFDRTWCGVANFTWIDYALKNDRYPGLSIMRNTQDFVDALFGGPLCGAFTEYLITAFNIDKYKEFYRKLDNNLDECLVNVFGFKLEEIEEKFIKYIKGLRVTDPMFANNIYDFMEKEMKDRNLI